MRSPSVGPGSSSYHVRRGRPGSAATIRARTSAGSRGLVIGSGPPSAVRRFLDRRPRRRLGERLILLEGPEQRLGTLGVPLDGQGTGVGAVGEVGGRHGERQT